MGQPGEAGDRLELGARLRGVRKGLGLTLRAVWVKTGLSVSFISDMERGRTWPSILTLEKLAACYQVSVADLLDGSLSAQERVALLIEARGYREGWDAQAFAARQCCKLTEELTELIQALYGDGAVNYHVWAFFLSQVGKLARGALDGPRELWEDDQVQVDVLQAMKELADLQVVVFCLAQVLAELAGQPFDVVRAAIEKAEADVGRRVRGQIEEETGQTLDK